MLSEKDKKNLFGGKKCICKYFAKRKAIKELNSFIREADVLLDTYKEVDFDNVFITALQQSSRLLFEEQKWSQAVDDCLLKVFNYQQSEIKWKFNSIILPDAISDYAKIRYRLTEKRRLLYSFLKELEDLR